MLVLVLMVMLMAVVMVMHALFEIGDRRYPV